MNDESVLNLGQYTHHWAYWIYGNEFINALATELGCKSSLKEVEIPTIFHCDIPIAVDEVIPCNIVDYEHPEEVEDPYYGYTKYCPNYTDLVANGFCYFHEGLVLNGN